MDIISTDKYLNSKFYNDVDTFTTGKGQTLRLLAHTDVFRNKITFHYQYGARANEDIEFAAENLGAALVVMRHLIANA